MPVTLPIKPSGGPSEEIKTIIDLVQQSYGRCCVIKTFFDDFYADFTKTSPKIRDKCTPVHSARSGSPCYSEASFAPHLSAPRGGPNLWWQFGRSVTEFPRRFAMPRPIAGVLPIAHTPFLDNDEIDHASLKRQIDWALSRGADGYCTGMVSELLRLTASERIELTHKLVEYNAGRGVVVMSVGAESTKQALLYAREAERAGCDAMMAIPPTTVALPDDQLLAYYVALAEANSLPLIVQDASGYVGKAIPMSINLELLKRFGAPKILFKPEASPIGPNLSRLRDATGGEARVFEGSGGILLIDSHRRGIAGTMPGMEFLDGIIAVWRALRRGDDATAYRIYFPICALVALQLQAGLDGFLAVEKYLLHKTGIFATPHRRRPFAWEMDDETTREIDRLYEILTTELAAANLQK